MPATKDKKRNTWTAQFYYTDWTGKKVKKCKRGFETKKEAQDWEKRFLLEKSASLDMTFEDFWKRYEADVKPKVRENTWKSKEYVVNLKILPYFKDLIMRDITPREVIQWQNEMRESTDKEGNAYSGTYLRKMQAELSAIFNHAVKYYELPKNPAVIAGPLGQQHSDEMKFWTKEEYMRFIPTMANKTYSYMSFELLYWCGIRMGEHLALTPGDFDFERNKMSITKSLQRISGRDVVTKPKTKKSIRVISIPNVVAQEMKDFLDSIYGIRSTDRIFVLSKSYLHHEMDRGVKESGVKRIRIHDLRHSHVSLLIDMGFSAVAIGNRVGHESAEITYRYAHMMPSIQDEMAEALDEERRDLMSAKNNDPKGRYRSETIAYRCSPEEREELDKRWRLLGYGTKQDYVLDAVLHNHVEAKGNPQMLVSFRKELQGILAELQRIDEITSEEEELFTPIRTMLEILEAFKAEADAKESKKKTKTDKFLGK